MHPETSNSHPTRASAVRELWPRHRWSMAGGAILAATGLTVIVLQFRLPLNPMMFYLLAVMASAFWGGYGPGLLATILSSFVVPPLLIPGYSLAQTDVVRLVTFSLLSIVIGWIRERELRAEAGLRRANENLEQRVAERTALLSAEITQRKQAQEDLATSEQRFRALIEHSADGFAVLTGESVFTYVGHEVLGYDAGRLVGTRILDLLHPDDKDDAAEALRRIDGIPRATAALEFRIRDPRGAWRWVAATVRNALEVNGINGMVLTYRDVTERRQAELAHREQSKRLQIALNAGRMGTWEWDLERQQITWSDQLKSIHGMLNTSFDGTPESVRDRFHSDDLEGLTAAIRLSIDTGQPFQHEYRIVRPDGEIRWVLSQGQTLYEESSGRPLRTVGVTMDVAERRLGAEAAAKLAAIVEHSDDAIISHDLDNIVQTWNRGAERLYGYSAAEMLGQSLERVVPPDRMAEHAAAWQKVCEGAPVQHLDTVRLRKDGSQLEVSVTVSPICDSNGRIIGYSHVCRDISRQKRLDEQLRQTQKLESLGVLAGGISHDFNNLLVGIMGNASIVLDDLPASSANRAILEDVVVASERAADLTRQLLAYAGKGKFVIRRVDLSQLVGEMTKLVQTSIAKKVQLQLELAADAPPVLVDPVQIQQIVMNLVVNGAEAIGEDTGVVIVATGSESLSERDLSHMTFAVDSAPGRYVYVKVQDSGCGMDEETKRKIFDPFFTTKFTGRGLGLAAVLGIVRAHRGALLVESEVGRGTSFQVFLPVAVGSLEIDASEAAERPRDTGTVLVIDDEPVVRRMAQAALGRAGFDVLVAENGKAGVRQFLSARERIRLIVLDLTMPGLGGEETIRELRQLNCLVPVILSSGFNESEAGRNFDGYDLAGFLQKPYTADQLMRAVHKASSSSGSAALAV